MFNWLFLLTHFHVASEAFREMLDSLVDGLVCLVEINPFSVVPAPDQLPRLRVHHTHDQCGIEVRSSPHRCVAPARPPTEPAIASTEVARETSPHVLSLDAPLRAEAITDKQARRWAIRFR